MKYAIRIVNSEGKYKLFAIVIDKDNLVSKYRQLARESIPTGSSDWVEAEQWSMDIAPNWWEFPAGDLF